MREVVNLGGPVRVVHMELGGQEVSTVAIDFFESYSVWVVRRT